ncbi:Sec-independent protein translocase TatB [Herbiconiux sp. P18]|uniref:Sec-independent protein translocase TatB n=1 Tax=Herbiconiux liangxiaofengii TaxID=3342795 RepID=UPI0035B7175C
MFGLTFEKLLLIGIIAVFLLGPERLPGYAAKLAQLVRTVRDMANGAKDRMRDEMGPDFDDVDWKKLDPRQYDPRRIIREALLDDGSTDAAGTAAAAATVRPAARTRPEPAYLQHKAKSAGGPVAVTEPQADAAGAEPAARGAADAGGAGTAPGASVIRPAAAFDTEAT